MIINRSLRVIIVIGRQMRRTIVGFSKFMKISQLPMPRDSEEARRETSLLRKWQLTAILHASIRSSRNLSQDSSRSNLTISSSTRFKIKVLILLTKFNFKFYLESILFFSAMKMICRLKTKLRSRQIMTEEDNEDFVFKKTPMIARHSHNFTTQQIIKSSTFNLVSS